MTEYITGKCWIMHSSGVATGPYNSPQEASKNLREGDEIIPHFDPAQKLDEQRKNFQRMLVEKKIFSRESFIAIWGEQP